MTNQPPEGTAPDRLLSFPTMPALTWQDVNNLRLCFVETNGDDDAGWTLYFTTLPISMQRADDWNDSFYQHNASPPYVYGAGDASLYRPPWHIITLWVDGPFLAPDQFVPDGKTPSVDAINRRQLPWLVGTPDTPVAALKIWAGTTLEGFYDLIRPLGDARVLEIGGLAAHELKGMGLTWMQK